MLKQRSTLLPKMLTMSLRCVEISSFRQSRTLLRQCCFDIVASVDLALGPRVRVKCRRIPRHNRHNDVYDLTNLRHLITDFRQISHLSKYFFTRIAYEQLNSPYCDSFKMHKNVDFAWSFAAEPLGAHTTGFQFTAALTDNRGKGMRTGIQYLDLK